MYCSCSNKNNYEVISLCDIKKFTDKNGPFNNKPWVQISVADVLMLDCTKLAIEKIEKIYIDVSIVSTKIIDTPISPSPNSEGMTLTGKKLLIDGFICSKIVYTSLTKEQSVYTSKFMVPFCTYIVIERDADVFNDKYCVKTCIEDVFLSLIDCKTIFQNVTLFLLAERTSFTCAMPQPPKENCNIITRIFMRNSITLNDTNNEAVLSIKFDKLNMQIVSDFTNNLSALNGGINYFTFILYDQNTQLPKKTVTLAGNENGKAFSKELTDTFFNFGDIVKLQYKENNKVIINDFPDSTVPVYNPKGNEEIFIIGNNELLPYIASEIQFGTPNLSKVTFDSITKRISAISTSVVKSGPDAAIFLFKLRDGNNNDTIKSNSRISFNENTAKFAQDLNNSPFNVGDIIELNIALNNTAKLINSPSIAKEISITTITVPNKFFLKIKEFTIEPITLTTIPNTPKLKNSIIIKDINTRTPLFTFNFNTLDNVLDINSFGTFSVPNTYFNLKLAKATKPDISGTLGGSNLSNTNSFLQTFNNIFFKYGDKLEFDFTNGEKASVSITNFLQPLQDYTPTNNKEIYVISNNGLLPYISNEIHLGNPELSKITFDSLTNQISVLSTSNSVTTANNEALFLFKLRDGNNSDTIKAHSLIASNLSASNFASALNNTSFNLGDIIELQTRYGASGKITNIPNLGADFTILNNEKTSKNFVQITVSGLKLISPNTLPITEKLNNTITIKNFQNQNPILSISFNKVDKILDITYLNTFNITTKYFNFEIVKKNGAKFNKTLGGSGSTNTDEFIKGFTNLLFDYGDVLKFDFIGGEKSAIIITNLLSQGQDYTPSKNKESYEITPNGLKLIPPLTLPNTITIKKVDDSILGNIAFDVENKEFFLTSFNSQYSSSGDNYNILELRLYNPSSSQINLRIKNSIIKAKDNARSFFNDLNNTSFDFGYIIELNYDNRSKNSINISNFKTLGVTHTPIETLEYYKITPTGLVSYNPLPQVITFFRDNTSLCTFEFDTAKKQIIPKNLNAINSAVDNFSISLNWRDPNTNFISGEFNSKNSNNASTFTTQYPNAGRFEIIDANFITVFASGRNHAIISDFPTVGQTYRLDLGKEFTLTMDGLKFKS